MAMTAQVQNIISSTANFFKTGVSLANATEIEINDALCNGDARLTDSVTQGDIDSVVGVKSYVDVRELLSPLANKSSKPIHVCRRTWNAKFSIMNNLLVSSRNIFAK